MQTLDSRSALRLADFDYELPEGRIAQAPLPRREESRLLVLHRGSGTIEHRRFWEVLDYFRPGDILLLNDTKVKPARMIGHRPTGGKVEALLLRQISPRTYEALLHPSSKLKTGEPIFFSGDLEAEVIGRPKGEPRSPRFAGEAGLPAGGNGTVKTIRFRKGNAEEWIKRHGGIPLPPYIRRPPVQEDADRYQTVYARREGAVAAPTAGLHFTKEFLKEIEGRGICLCRATLHIGYGTFEPVREEEITRHKMHEEYFEISEAACRTLNAVRRRGGRIVAVGTTSCRVLETSVQQSLQDGLETVPIFRSRKGWTDLFIHPPYEFRGTDVLITNFHLPKSTLLMLVSAFAGVGLIRKAYREAIEEGYRFYSYGDAMLIL